MPKDFTTKGMGMLPSLMDMHDHPFKAAIPRTQLPPRVDLRTLCPSVYDQGNLGSCVAQSVVAMFDMVRKKQGQKFMTPSKLFVYYNARVYINTVNSDSGAFIRDGIKTIVKDGVARELNWPYVISKFKVKPSKALYDQAERYQALEYLSVNNENLFQMKSCLAEGYPIVVGSSLYENFYNAASSGIVPMPAGDMIGGHAMLLVGYDDSKNMFLERNSWGKSWGLGGYHWRPYDYLKNRRHTNDCWTLRTVEIQ